VAQPLDTTIPIHDPRVRWKAFQIPLSSPDTSGRWGHEWPGSRLTGDDMRRLAVLGTVAMPVTREPALITHPAVAPADDHGSLAAETAHDGPTSLSIPPHPVAKRTAAPAPREGITDDRIQELQERMQRLQETMDVLIGSIDEFREDLVHTLRNLPDQIPPPVHIHSLPPDPTAPDFGERINGIPVEVMARLREEAASGEGAPAVATAAEGDPSPAHLVDPMAGNGNRAKTRQGKRLG